MMARIKLSICGRISAVFVISSAFALIALSEPTANAQEGGGGSTGVGGGGAAMVCFKTPETLAKVKTQRGLLDNNDVKEIEFIETYDLFLARRKRGFEMADPRLVLSKENESFQKYAERLASRFDYTIPSFSEVIRNAANEIHHATVTSDYQGVLQLEDMAPAVASPDINRCAEITVANQYLHGVKLYIEFDRRLLELMSLDSLNTLMLHEGTYAQARRNNKETTSRSTRDFLALALATLDKTAAELAEQGRQLGFVPSNQPGYYATYDERFVAEQMTWAFEELDRLAEEYDEAHPADSKAIRKKVFWRIGWSQIGEIPLVGMVTWFVPIPSGENCVTHGREQQYDPMSCVFKNFPDYYAARAKYVKQELIKNWHERRRTVLAQRHPMHLSSKRHLWKWLQALEPFESDPYLALNSSLDYQAFGISEAPIFDHYYYGRGYDSKGEERFLRYKSNRRSADVTRAFGHLNDLSLPLDGPCVEGAEPPVSSF